VIGSRLPLKGDPEFDKNHVSDLTPLRALTRLKLLAFEENDVEDATPLGSVPSMVEIYTMRNKLRDFPDLAHFPKIGWFDLESNPIPTKRRYELEDQLMHGPHYLDDDEP